MLLKKQYLHAEVQCYKLLIYPKKSSNSDLRVTAFLRGYLCKKITKKFSELAVNFLLKIDEIVK